MEVDGFAEQLAEVRRSGGGGLRAHESAGEQLDAVSLVFGRLKKDCAAISEYLSFVESKAGDVAGWAERLKELMTSLPVNCYLHTFEWNKKGGFTATLRAYNHGNEDSEIPISWNGKRWLPYRTSLRDIIETTGLSAQFFEGLVAASEFLESAWQDVDQKRREYDQTSDEIKAVVRADLEQFHSRTSEAYRYGRHGVLRRWREASKDRRAVDLPQGLDHLKDDLREFDLHASAPCHVYFLLHLGEIVYVGQSTELPSRIEKHKEDKVFDRVVALECDLYSLNATEKKYIRLFTPKYNQTGNPKAVRRVKGGVA